MAFDFDGAEAAGLSQEAILKELEKSGKVGYDFTGARKAGISTNEIYSTIKTKMSQPTDLPALPEELPDVIPGPPEDYEVSEDGTYNIPGITATPTYSPEGTIVTDEEAKEVGLQPLPPRTKTENTIGEEIIGGLETAATLATSATTGAIGAIVGQGAAATEQTKRRLMGDKLMTDAEYEAYASGPAQALTYEPRTKAGKEDVAAIGKELAVFEYMSPLLVETAGLSALAKTKVDGMLAKRSKVLGELAADPLALSAEAKYLIAKHPDLDDKTVIEKLSGVKLADQAHALTRYLQEPGYAEKAIAEGGSKAAGHLRAKLDMERLKFISTVGNADMAQAKFQYGDMVRKIGEGYTGVHDASGLATNVNALFEVHGIAQGRVGTTVRGLKQAIGQDGRLSLQDALDVLPDINYMYNSAKRGVEKARIKEIKTEVQQFINSVATPEQQKLMDNAISNYSKTAQNNDILEIVSKHTNPQGFAVNWTKVHRDMEDAGLRSPEAVRSLRIAEAYATKFGNAKELGELALPVGTSPSAGGVMGVMGLIANGVRNIAAKAELGVGIQTNRGTDLRIQESILKTIMKDLQSSKSELDFVDRLMKDTKISEETKIDLKGIFEPRQIQYKAGARQTGDVNLEPIVTPVGGRDMTPPAQVVDDVIPTKPSNTTEHTNQINPQDRIDQLMANGDRTAAETIELRGLQDRMIEEGTGHKDDVVSRFEGMSEAELLAKRNEMVNTPERNRNATWQQEWEEVNNAYARAPAASNELPSTKPSEVDTTVEKPYSRAEDERAATRRSYDDLSIEEQDKYDSLQNTIDDLDTNDPDYEDFYASLVAEKDKLLSRVGKPSEAELFEALKDAEASGNTEKFNRIRAMIDGEAPITPINSISQLQRAEETFNTLRRDISRLERVRVADRTPQQSAQLSEMRRERLLASREVERLRAGGESADRLFNSFRGSNHTIRVINTGNNRFEMVFNGNRIKNISINTRNNTISLNTQDFAQGSGQGAQFYKEFYKALDSAGLKHNVSGLTSVNQMRLPINIYKHKLDTGNLPITGGQQTLQLLMRSAINKINEVSGREIKHLTDGQLEELAKRTGPMIDVHAGVASLKLYRKAARLLSDGRALSVGALAPFINQAYSEIEGEGNDTETK